MPVVAEAQTSGSRTLLPRCANPRCATSWIRLWRSRRVPGFEGRWACSPECMEEIVGGALRRESGGTETQVYRHRIPLGLLLVEQGHLSAAQLHMALEEQRRAAEQGGGAVRLGEWLVAKGILREEVLARALGAQWGSPVLRLSGFRPGEMAAALPAFFSEALGAMPVRVAPGGILYLAFGSGVDRSLSYAVERMTGLAVTAGVARDSEFHSAQRAFVAAAAPRARFLEAATSAILARAVTRVIEGEKPLEARLVRVHQWYWLRLWKRVPGSGLPEGGDVEDMLCTVGSIRRGE